MADDLVQKLRDSATWISDNVYLDGHAGYSNLRHAAADEIESLRALAEAAQKVFDVEADIEEFDGDKRGMYAALAKARRTLRAALARYRGEGT